MTVIGYDITIIETVAPEDLKIAEGKAGRLQRMFAKSREQKNAKRNQQHQVRIAVLCENVPQRSKPINVCHKLHTHSNNNFNTIHARQKIQRQCRELI